jgi:hypothetical protein
MEDDGPVIERGGANGGGTMLKGIEFGEVRDILAQVFSPDEFDMFLYERLEFNRPRRVQDGPFDVVVGRVLHEFEMNGLDPYLIAEVAAKRPRRPDVQKIYRKYAKALLTNAQQEAVEAKQLDLLDKYGLAPRVEVREAGRPQFSNTVSPTFEGFQRRVRQLLPSFDLRLWFAQYLRNEQRVCQIEVDGRPRGSGFLVGEDAVLTNCHVLEDVIAEKASGGRVHCRFDYRIMGNGVESAGIVVALKGSFDDWYVDSSPPLSDRDEDRGDPPPTPDQLDHALVLLDRPLGAEQISMSGPLRGWIHVPSDPTPLELRSPLMIIQYPNGQPVKLAFDTEAVQGINIPRTRVRYATNSDPGSSGSPCFNIQWGLIALHHFGDPFSKPARYNQGIPVRAIRERLAREGRQGALGELVE